MISGKAILRLADDAWQHGRATFGQSKPFSYLVLATAGSTGLWLLISLGGGSGRNGGSPGPQAPPIFTGTPITAVPMAPPQQAYQFGSIQSTPPAMDPASEQRQRQFLVAANVAGRESRQGARCDLLVQAARVLTPLDRAHPLPPAMQALNDADTCQALVDQSNSRLHALVTTGEAFESDQTPAKALALVRAGSAITDFDRTRGEADKAREAFGLVPEAGNELRDSDARLKAFATAAPGAEPGAALGTEEKLVAAAHALTEFDRARLTQEQQATFVAAAGLATSFSESDRRIAAVSAAMNGPDVGEPPRRLIDTVGALTPLDLARASPAQRITLSKAQSLARDAALVLLVPAATRFSADRSPAAVEELARLRRLLGATDPATLSPDQRQALGTASAAAATLAESDDHLQAMTTALEAWRTSPTPLTAPQITDAYRDLSEFDRARFTAGQEIEYRRLQAAHTIALGSAITLSPLTKAEVPIYVAEISAKADIKQSAAQSFRDSLVGAGYDLVENRRDAALIVDLTGTLDHSGETQYGPGAVTTVAFRAIWSLDGVEFGQNHAAGNGIGTTQDLATEGAFRTGGARAFERFNELVQAKGKS